MTDDKLLLATLYEKTSKTGNLYFSGRLGKLIYREPKRLPRHFGLWR